MGQTIQEESLITAFSSEHRLPQHFLTLAKRYFLPLAEEMNTLAAQKPTLIVGINGCQGSGKSTLAALLDKLLTQVYDKTVANLSIDDFYHTKEYRQKLAIDNHPLFKTRGVPGTHDVELLKKTLLNLTQNNKGTARIPRFNKATDNRYEEDRWSQIDTPVDIILLEGWCVGVTAQTTADLSKAINTLEENEDTQGLWRQMINASIDKEYQALLSKIDHLIMLKAPNFECVYQWRQKQEDKLRQSVGENTQESAGIMEPSQLKRFIEHYQRLTEHMLCYLPQQADVVFELDHQHQIAKRTSNGNA